MDVHREGPRTVAGLNELVVRYESGSDDELAAAVTADYDLTEAIVSAHPEMAQDAGFELFDREWAKRYWKTVVGEISGAGTTSEIRAWAMGATVSGVAEALISTFGLPPTVLPAAVALAFILIRAARSAPPDDPNE
jgi:hypothetical protein